MSLKRTERSCSIFLLSADINDDKASNDPEQIVERNVYRYNPYIDKNGTEGVLLFGVSERAYGNDIRKFLTSLKANRFDVPNAAGAFVIPGIEVGRYKCYTSNVKRQT